MHALIVDDSKVVRTASSRILEQLRISFDIAEDGAIALDKVKTKNFDLILLDWNMPNMDGLQFLKAAKAANCLNGAKVIFCTTESEIEKISAALNEGANEYVMKPFDKEILEEKLRYLGLVE